MDLRNINIYSTNKLHCINCISFIPYFFYLQLCISAENNKCRPDIIFRSNSGGKCINKAEKNKYHPSVDIFWQKSAWADTPVSLEWIEKTLKPAVKNEKNTEFLLLCDNLSCQVKNEFKDAVRKINGLVYYGIKGKNLHKSFFILILN